MSKITTKYIVIPSLTLTLFSPVAVLANVKDSHLIQQDLNGYKISNQSSPVCPEEGCLEKGILFEGGVSDAPNLDLILGHRSSNQDIRKNNRWVKTEIQRLNASRVNFNRGAYLGIKW